MGGHVDRFIVRLVLALTVVSWASVLVHDAFDPQPAEGVSSAATQAEPPTPIPTMTVPPTNATPDGSAPQAALFVLA
jgi:hypothetical protein